MYLPITKVHRRGQFNYPPIIQGNIYLVFDKLFSENLLHFYNGLILSKNNILPTNIYQKKIKLILFQTIYSPKTQKKKKQIKFKKNVKYKKKSESGPEIGPNE